MVAITKTEIKKRYDELMASEHPFYLDPDCSLVVLASILRVNRSYASNFINDEFGTNFSTHINDLRLQYLLIQKKKNPKSSWKSLAIASGFSSEITFRRSFIRKMGISPGQYVIADE